MNHESGHHHLLKTETDVLDISLIWCCYLVLVVDKAVTRTTGKGFFVECKVTTDNSKTETVANSKRQSENHLSIINLL